MSRILSLCTGYAGLDLAVEAVTAARTVAVSDIDKGACKILAHRLPDIPNLGNLKDIDWATWAGIEVMTAGYPCQPFSHAGKREGTDDPRHIFPFIAEGIRIVGPRLVVLENVRGHLALGFDTVLGTLADIGYDARWVCLRASDVGAPHRRERLFIVATPSAHNLGHERTRSSRGWRERSADLGDLAPNAGGERHGRREDGRGLGRLDRAHEGSARQRERPWEVAGDRGAEAAADAESVRHGYARPSGLGGLASPAVTSAPANTEGDEQREPLVRLGERPESRRCRDGHVDWGKYGPAVNRWAAVLGRPAPDPTEPGAKGQPRLSPRFVEFMMGLPAGWVTDVPDLTRNEQLKALGNGVVPQQAAAALTFLLRSEEVAA